jgi:hypothetical protein
MYKSADWWVQVQTANSRQFTIPLPHKKSKVDAMVNSNFVNPKEKLWIYNGEYQFRMETPNTKLKLCRGIS